MTNQKMTKISQVLKNNDFKIKKKFGQNYILDMNLTNKIVKNSMPLCTTPFDNHR